VQRVRAENVESDQTLAALPKTGCDNKRFAPETATVAKTSKSAINQEMRAFIVYSPGVVTRKRDKRIPASSTS
jgi:hypothetical protein